ncbi:hypothetical protein VCHA53O466_140213 [Vibrio chagasii]|nr:hypothetical protein VCHA53O466_140213 [Vibrio chagasii]
MKNKGGFTLVEMMLGLSVLGAGVLIWSAEQKKETASNEEARFAREIASVASGIDRRIFGEGNSSSSWISQEFNGTSATISNMIKANLVGSEVTECGSWTSSNPSIGSNEQLVPCSLWDGNFIPFGFKVDGEIVANESGLSEWVITFSHSSADGFNERAKLYSDLIERIKAHQMVHLSGYHSVGLVDLTTGDILDAPVCLGAGVQCGIEVKYSVFNNSILNVPYLRVDGENSLLSSLSILTTESEGVTGKSCRTVSGERIPCGFDFDLYNDKFENTANRVSASSYTLSTGSFNSGATGAPASCLYSSGGTYEVRTCGIMSTDDTIGAEEIGVLSDRLIANEVIISSGEFNGTDDSLLTINKDEMVSMVDVRVDEDLEVEQLDLRGNNLTVNYTGTPDAGSKAILEVNSHISDLFGDVSMRIAGGISSRTFTVGAGDVNQACTIGQVSVHGTDGILMCDPATNQFGKLGATSDAMSVIVPMAGGCPSGYSAVSSGRILAQTGGAVVNRNSGFSEYKYGEVVTQMSVGSEYGSNSVSMFLSEMPSHSHSYSYYQAHSGGSSRSGNKRDYANHYWETVSNPASNQGAAFNVAPPAISVMYCVAN